MPLCWRPAMIDGEPSSSQPALTRALRPLLRAMFKPFRSMYVENIDIGRAHAAGHKEKARSRIIENAELRTFADRYRGLS